MTAIDVGSDETVGMLVKRWRERRRRSQLDVSLAADLSTRHLSYIETGRSTPSREMIERICDELDVPLRERNRFYLAAGFAPRHPERALADLGAAREAVRAVLRGMEPNPAVAVNLHWDLLAANDAMTAFLGGLPDELTGPPLNILRATLHPRGLAPRSTTSRNGGHMYSAGSGDSWERSAAPGLSDLLSELEGYDHPFASSPASQAGNDLVVPLQMTTPYGQLALLYAATIFGSPRDVTLDEIAIETFFPADSATANILRSLTDARA